MSSLLAEDIIGLVWVPINLFLSSCEIPSLINLEEIIPLKSVANPLIDISSCLLLSISAFLASTLGVTAFGLPSKSSTAFTQSCFP